MRGNTAFVAAGLLVLGAAGGAAVTAALGGHPNHSQTALEAEVGNAASTRRALESLRSGDTATAIETLETALSLNVVVLDEFLRELEPPAPEAAVRMLASIARYRSEHPYSSSVREADQNVASILARYETR